MELGLRGKAALITGASKGIGRACAEALAAEGVSVALCAREPSPLEAAITAIQAANPGVRTIGISADMSVPEDVERFVEQAAAWLERIDILVNVAGASRFGPFETLPDDAWESAMALKYLGYVRCARAVVPHMRRVGGGRIVNIVGNGGRHSMIYHMPGSASNAALLNFTKNLADTLAPDNILVNAINPGLIETDRYHRLVDAVAAMREVDRETAEADLLAEVPLRRPGRPEEIAAAVLFLASPQAAYITGTSLLIDGGMSKLVP